MTSEQLFEEHQRSGSKSTAASQELQYIPAQGSSHLSLSRMLETAIRVLLLEFHGGTLNLTEKQPSLLAAAPWNLPIFLFPAPPTCPWDCLLSRPFYYWEFTTMRCPAARVVLIDAGRVYPSFFPNALTTVPRPCTELGQSFFLFHPVLPAAAPGKVSRASAFPLTRKRPRAGVPELKNSSMMGSQLL